MSRVSIIASAVSLVVLGFPDAASAEHPLGMLKNTQTQMCADLPYFGPGRINGPVNQYYCHRGSGDNQMWRLLSAGRPDEYAIQNGKDGFCMDVPGTDAVAPGTHITEYRCRLGDQDNQMFIAGRRGPYGFYLRNAKTGLCLDVSGRGRPGTDAPLTLWHCAPLGEDDHYWRFE